MRGLFVSMLLLSVAIPAQAAPATKWLVVVQGVEDAEGVHSGVTDQARQIFVDELKKHPELTLEAPPGLPSEPEALKKALVQQHLRALEVTLRILKVTSEVLPPPEGKRFRVLQRGIKLSVFGDSLPEKVLAIGGDGDATVGVEIAANANLEAEGKPALTDALKEAVRQAVDMTVTKLKLGDKPPKVKRRKK